jgi:amino acid permease
MATETEKEIHGEKLPEHTVGPDVEHGHHEQKSLARNLQGRHMQMIAIGELFLRCIWERY